MALVLASVYHRQRQENVSDLVGYLGLVFIMLTFTACVNSTSVLELIHQERPSFNRERFAGSYSVGAYALAWLLVEVPYVLVQSFLFLDILYFFAHFSRDVWRVSWFWAFLFLYMLFATAFGQALAAVTPSTQTAQTFYNTLAPIFSIMSGMTFMPSDIPQGWLVLWVLCPLNKAFEGVVMTQWWEDDEGRGNGGQGGEEATITVFNSVTRSFEKRTRWGAVQWFFGEEEGRVKALGFSFEHRWRNLWVLVVFVVGCNILFMCALKWRRFERR
jgi:ABC-type multidrug transport system permease subunit|eukprot:evm.model.NODE_45085_length_15355_cov_24.615108.2